MRYIGPRRALLSGGTPPSLDLRFTAGGGLDPRITFTRASTGSYFDYTGTLQSAATNVARFDYDPVLLTPRGLLIEEARTNGIRNNTMVGAVPGTPGTLPTNWRQSTGTGITPAVIGTGTESGIPYIDLQFVGTATTSNQAVWYETKTGAAALTGQTWTASQNIRLVAGSLTNVTAITNTFYEYTSGGTFVTGNNAGTFLGGITGSPLASQRFSGSYPTSGGGTVAALEPALGLFLSAGAVNFTLRIGMPQLEQGAFATSPILTSGSAATRAADVATMPVGSWFNASAICVALEGTMLNSPVGGAGNSYWFSLDDGTAANRITLLTPSAGARVDTVIASGGIIGANQDNVLVLVPPASFKYAIQVAGGVYTSCQNGGFYNSYATTAPVGITRFALGTGGDTQINGYLRRVRYWSRAMSPAELQANTR